MQIIVRPLSLKGHSHQGSFLRGRKQMSLQSSRRAWEITFPITLTLITGNVMDHILLEAIFKHLEDIKVIESSQHGFLCRGDCAWLT